jgi:hypothetical protein
MESIPLDPRTLELLRAKLEDGESIRWTSAAIPWRMVLRNLPFLPVILIPVLVGCAILEHAVISPIRAT